jgi:hypothetical protein
MPCSLVARFHACVSQKKPVFALGANLAISRALLFSTYMLPIFTLFGGPLSSHATFGVNVQHERQLLSTGHGRHVSITTTLVPISVFARCPVASRFHSIPGELLTSLGTSSLRPQRTFVPLSPTQPSLQQQLPRPRVQRRSESSMIILHGSTTPSPIMFPSLD